MPRSLLRDPDTEIVKRIFGAGATKLRVPELSEAIRVPKSTIYNWMKKPRLMPLYSFAKIAKTTEMTDAQILQIVRSIK